MSPKLTFFQGLWALIESENNEILILALTISIFSILVSYFIVTKQFKNRLKDKDERIEDLIKQRNLYEKHFFSQINKKRKTTAKK